MDMNKERKLQELASRLVEREVLCCVSSLVDTLSTLARHCDRADISWEEDILPLLEGYDWEAATDAAIEDADLEQLEEMADFVGYWSDVLAMSAVPSVYEKVDDEGEFEPTYGYEGCDELSYDTEEEAEFAAQESAIDTIRSNIKALVTDHQEFCQEFDVDMDDYRQEVYEHWIVTSWLHRKLGGMGYVAGELCGLDIYGRSCTGQSMSLDWNMQQIAAELWPEELKEFE